MKIRYVIVVGIILLSLVGCAGKVTSEKSEETASEFVEQEATEAAVEEEVDHDELRAILEENLEKMAKDPKDTKARLEVIRSQIGLENYTVAQTNLQMLLSIDPTLPEIYEYYLQISEETNNISLAADAVSKANLYEVNEFLEKVPKEPAFSVKGGSYQDKLTVELSTDDPEAKIYYWYSVDGESRGKSQYIHPIMLVGREVTLNAYVVKDGVPSNTVAKTYRIDYAGVAISFADATVEKAVREQIKTDTGVEEGVITDVDCWKLTQLTIDCEDSEVVLDDLKHMPNLTSLTLNQARMIRDFDSLKNCSRLTYLSAYGGKIENLEFVNYMPDLANLYLGDNQISDISPLKNCTNLRNLTIYRNPIRNLDELIQICDFYYLYISDDQISDYGVLSEEKTLKTLYIYGTEFDAMKLDQLTWMESFSISIDWNEVRDYDNLPGLSDISFIHKMKKLTYLSLQGVEDAEQLKNLYGLEKLQTLYLYNSTAAEDAEAMRSLRTALPNCSIYN